jgi:uncharacterized membrane protein
MLLILAVGFALRFYHIGEQSLWIDEAEMYSKAALPDLRSVIGPVLGYAEPPLYVGLLHFWLKLGDTDTNLRLLSVLFGVGTIYLFYELFTVMFNQTVGIWSAVLLAINPVHVWYSQEARMYALLLFLFTLSTLFLWKAIENPRGWNWVVYGASLLLCSLTHIGTLFLGLSHGLFILLQKNRRAVMMKSLATYSIVGFILFPMVLNFIKGFSENPIPQVDKPFSILNLGYVFFSQGLGFSFGPSIYDIQKNLSVAVIRPYWMQISWAALIFLIPLSLGLLWCWKTSRRHDRREWWLMALMLTVPSLVPFALDGMTQMTLNPRHVLVCLIPYVGFLALGINSMVKPWATCSFLAIAAVSAISLSNLYWNPRYAKEDARGTATYLAGVADYNTPIFVASFHKPIKRYLGSFRVYGPMRMPFPQSPDIESNLKALSANSTRFFFVDLRSEYFDPNGRIESTCNLLFNRLAERKFHGIRVVQYENVLGISPSSTLPSGEH